VSKLAAIAGQRTQPEKPIAGVQYVTDAKGRKTAVLIDLRKYKTLWEDFRDGLISEERSKEKNLSYREYRTARLRNQAKRG
jgi:hypothetical protein